MTNLSDSLARYRLPLSRDRLKQAGALIAPALRYAPRNPLLLVGALLVGVAGVLAWRNREKIARTATPIIQDARIRGHGLIDEAIVKGQQLMDDAKATTQAISAKTSRLRTGAADRTKVSGGY